MVCSCIAGVATRHSLDDEYWRPSYDLALLSARRAVENLVAECKERKDFIEGHPLGDGYFYGTRQTILTGLVAVWALNKRRVGEHTTFPSEFFRTSIRGSFYWGESATPYLALAALELEQRCFQRDAEGLMFEMLKITSLANERSNRGLPDVFTSIDDSLVFQYRLKPYERRSYAGFSYTIEPVIEYLARRWRRQGLALRWKGLTRISLMTSVPNRQWEWFRWRAEDLTLASRMFPEPQSWNQLRTQAEARTTSALPPLMQREAEFLSYFVLVFPHRFNVHTMKGLEIAFGWSWQRT